MKYPTPTTTIECTVPGCTFCDEIELKLHTWVRDVWIVRDGWDEGWTTNEDGDAICPKHQEVPK